MFNFEGPGGTSNKGSIALLFGWRRVSKLLKYGGVAQLGEHLLCKQGVIGSNPFISTKGRTKADGRTFWQTWAHSSGG